MRMKSRSVNRKAVFGVYYVCYEEKIPVFSVSGFLHVSFYFYCTFHIFVLWFKKRLSGLWKLRILFVF